LERFFRAGEVGNLGDIQKDKGVGMREAIKAILPKLLSGRYYLTLVGGIVFAYAVWKNKLDPQATAAILTSIIYAYFQRTDRTQNGGQK